MATYSIPRSESHGFGAWLRTLRQSWRAQAERRRVYDRTFRELSQLTDRELSDIGISRLQISDIATEASHQA